MILTSAGWRSIYQEAICQLFANFPIGSSSACPLVTVACLCILLHLPSNCSLPTIPELSGRADSNRAPKGPLPWKAPFPAQCLKTLNSSTLADFPVLILLDEWIGDLPLVAEVVASQLAKITCPTGGNTSRTGSNGNPHPPALDARASAVTARAPAQVALAL